MNLFLGQGLKKSYCAWTITKKVPRGVSKNGFPITASVTSHWSTPAITLGLVRTMKSHQASIHQGAMAFDYHDIIGGDDHMW